MFTVEKKMMNLFITQQHRDAPNIWYFFLLGVIYWPEGRVDRTSFEVKHLAWMSRYMHQIKVIKRQNALLNLLYHYIVLQ